MRWLKMSKFLPELGWQPIIYTPENPDPSVIDESLMNEIHPQIVELKTPIWEPYDFYRKLTGKKSGAKFKAGYISEASDGNWKSRLSVFIRGNFLIPDPRKFWIHPSIRFLFSYLKEYPVDLIISTGPPHSMHLIALELKRKFNVKWIADFRDPWTDIDFYHKLRLTKWADKIHRKLEKKVLLNADHIVTVSPGCATDLEKIANRKVEVINNGFDPLDYQFEIPPLDKEFSITHFGAFNKDRNPSLLWEVLGDMAKSDAEFKQTLCIRLIGQTDESVINEIRKNGLNENIEMHDHLPHSEGLYKLSQSQILLLPLNDAPNAKGILPGKMYEYIALRRPILALGPAEADYSIILNEIKAGIPVSFRDKTEIKRAVLFYYSLYKEGKLTVEPGAYEKYSRRNLAEKFMKLAE